MCQVLLLPTSLTRVVIDVVSGFDVVDCHSLGKRLVTRFNVNCQAPWNEFICLVVSRHGVVQRALRVVPIVKILRSKMLGVLEAVVEINVMTLVIPTLLAVLWSQETVSARGSTSIVRIAVSDRTLAWLIRTLCEAVE